MKRMYGGDLVNMERNDGAQGEGSNEVKDVFYASLVLRECHPDVKREPPAVIALNKPKVTIGRSFDVDHSVVSTAVSRLHCAIRCCINDTDEWDLVDMSGNGVFINGMKVERDINNRLHNGDVINLASAEAPVVSYVFKSKAHNELTSSINCKRLKPEIQLPEPTQSTSTVKVVVDEVDEVDAEGVEDCVTPERLELHQKNKDLAVELEKMKDIMKQQEIALRQQWELEQEEKKKAEEAQAEARRKDEASEKEQWQQWLADLHAKHATALEEKNQLANRLQNMSDDKFKEAEIQKEKAQLELELKMKDSECSIMKHRLDELTSRNEESAALAIKMRDDVIKNVNETMETELQCSICSELFVKAATLNCAHSYCTSCINEWKQKKPECPICRQKIVSVTPSLVLDNFIEKIVDTLDTSMKERRKELLEERSNLPAPNNARNSVIVNPDIPTQRQTAAAAANRGTRARRRTRGGGPPRGNAQLYTQPIAVQIHQLRTGAVSQLRAVAPPQRGINLMPITYVNRPTMRSLLEAPGAAPNNHPLRPLNAPNNPHARPYNAPSNPPVMVRPRNAPNNPSARPHNVPSNPPARSQNASSNPPVMVRPHNAPNNPSARPCNSLPAGVQPIEISSGSQSEEDDVVSVPQGYYGGHGFCYRCGRHDHWANGCPF